MEMFLEGKKKELLFTGGGKIAFKSWKDESRINWGRELGEKQQLSNEEIQFGALLRIADAVEIIAKNHQRLINERDYYKQWYEQERQIVQTLRHRIAGLKGHIKRIKVKK